MSSLGTPLSESLARYFSLAEPSPEATEEVLSDVAAAGLSRELAFPLVRAAIQGQIDLLAAHGAWDMKNYRRLERLRDAIGFPVEIYSPPSMTANEYRFGAFAMLALLVIIGGIYFFGSVNMETGAAHVPESERAKPFAPPPRAEEAVDPARGPRPDTLESGLAVAVDNYFKLFANDYDSVRLVLVGPVVSWETDQWAQLVRYRSRNSFGAYVVATHIFIIEDGRVRRVYDPER